MNIFEPNENAKEEWLRLIGASGHQEALAVEWNPDTLKKIGMGVLSLGSKTQCLPAAMQQVADVEARLSQLRNDLGISRNAPADVLPRVLVVTEVEGRLLAPGRWIPDLLDRAACFDPVHASSRESFWLSERDLAAARLDHLIVLRGQRPTLKEVSFHESQIPDKWVSSGPSVFDAIFETASLIFGYPSSP